MVKLSINEEQCKGCSLCVTACPKKLLSLNSGKINNKGFHPAKVEETDKCTACGLCAVMCPDVAIKIEKE